MPKKESSKKSSVKSKKAAPSPVKKVTKRKPKATLLPIKVQIANTICDECDNSDDLLILDFTEGMAIILKRHNVTVSNTKNPDGMQPYQEPPQQKTFFHAFVLQWDGQPLTGNLVDMGVPVTCVETPFEAMKAISNA